MRFEISPRRSAPPHDAPRLRRLPSLSFLPLLIAVSLWVGCDRYPMDPERTLERALERGSLRVGLTEAPPWVTRRGDRPGGVEVALIESFARDLGLTLDWRWGPVEEHMHALERFELDLVAGGMTKKNPWSRKAGATRPYYQKHLVLAPPGENALLVRLERHLMRPPSEIEALLAREARP